MEENMDVLRLRIHILYHAYLLKLVSNQRTYERSMNLECLNESIVIISDLVGLTLNA